MKRLASMVVTAGVFWVLWKYLPPLAGMLAVVMVWKAVDDMVEANKRQVDATRERNELDKEWMAKHEPGQN